MLIVHAKFEKMRIQFDTIYEYQIPVMSCRHLMLIYYAFIKIVQAVCIIMRRNVWFLKRMYKI